MAVAAAATAPATVDDERPEEKEMDLLLSEIPQVTAPQGHRLGGGGPPPRHHGNSTPRHHAHGGDAYYAIAMTSRRDDGGHLPGGGGGGGFRVYPAPPSPFVGGAPTPLPQAADDPAEKLWLANQFRGLLVEDGAPAPANNAPPPDFSAAYFGYHFGAPGSSFHGEPLPPDQARAAAGYAAPPTRFTLGGGADVGLVGGHGAFPRALDASMGGFVYNRAGNGTGIGWGHPGHGHAEPFMLPGQQAAAPAEHNWGYLGSTGPIAFDPRGRSPKQQCEYGVPVPVAGNRYTKGFNQVEVFRREDGQNFDGKKNVPFLNRAKERRFQHHGNSRALELESPRMLRYENMVGVKGYIYFMAKDQNGCRFLQQKFEEEKHHVDVIFEGIIDHIAELMTNSFANYLIQKLLDVCDEEQRLRIIVVLTEDPVKLLRISLNTHGTRAIQKLIETVKTRKQIALIVSALEPGFMHLVNDLNGNHVIQKCLSNFGAEENKFIFDAAANHCFEMAIHRHGCCVLQKCITSARGENQAKLIVEVCAHAFQLAQDPFGNYVVQYVLDQRIPSANAHLASQFEGSYVYLSKQKVSSNVVEKCLKVFSDEDKAAIVFDLISVPHFEQLLQDPFANYVIHTALVNSRGHVHNALVEAIRPHEEALRTSPCCKRISRAISRR
ncbi:pumilio domain-containing protein C4G8.03c-like [Lolium rigidum]|uniref:pumilio domain-containing protein C4G8.03c-like n=1 Tax=Lolium rigidum TaxID=89674 RepID=UPI001F5DB47C|nr:pumilio domain-containing protein C4G8.03c-like [Lolium rigidum]